MNSSSSHLSWLQKATLLIEDYWTYAFNSIATLAYGLIGILITLDSNKLGFTIHIRWLYISAFLVIVANIGLWWNKERITKLKAQVEKNDLYTKITYDLIQDILADLSNSILNYSSTERISLYTNDGTNFLMIGRYSQNPEYCRKGRVIYPADQGIINTAWTGGEDFIENLPDPVVELENYLSILKEQYHISKKTSRSFSMKCRCYYGYAIRDVRQKTRIAVIVIESTRLGIINPDQIRSVLLGGEERRISEILEKIKPVIPDINTAIREGF